MKHNLKNNWGMNCGFRLANLNFIKINFREKNVLVTIDDLF